MPATVRAAGEEEATTDEASDPSTRLVAAVTPRLARLRARRRLGASAPQRMGRHRRAMRQAKEGDTDADADADADGSDGSSRAGDAPLLRYAGVASVGGQRLDLVLRNLTEYEPPQDAAASGDAHDADASGDADADAPDGGLAASRKPLMRRLRVRAGRSTKFEVCVVDGASPNDGLRRVPLRAFNLVIVVDDHVDASPSAVSAEKETVRIDAGFDGYVLADGTELAARLATHDDGSVAFYRTASLASAVGTARQDRPADPDRLSAPQAARALQIYYQNSACVNMTLSAPHVSGDDVDVSHDAQPAQGRGWRSFYLASRASPLRAGGYSCPPEPPAAPQAATRVGLDLHARRLGWRADGR